MSNSRSEIVQVVQGVVDAMKEGLESYKNCGKGDVPGVELYIDLLDEVAPIEKGKMGEILLREGKTNEKTLNGALTEQQSPLGKVPVDMGEAEEKDVEKIISGQKKSGPRDIRVSVEKLDALTNLVSELVVVNNMLSHSPDLEGFELPLFSKAAKQMNKIVRELRELSMEVRMVPVKNLFRRMHRLVYDVASKSMKEVELVIQGEETEMDKTVIEAIHDPLLHLIRNAIDHGLETAEERTAAGKNPVGVVTLKALHEEGRTKVIVSDDGGGLDTKNILEKARERGIVDEREVKDEDIPALIFHPGFSTKSEVTDLSGRGVGMDVVKRNIESVKGSIAVESNPGKGTSITLSIPLTLSITEGMLIKVGGRSFIVPLLSSREFIKPRNNRIVVSPEGGEMIRIRDEIIPIVRLHDLFEIVAENKNLEDGMLVIVETSRKPLALFVDTIVGQMQAVIKAVPEQMSSFPAVAGCSILGNGVIALILDVEKLKI